MAGKDAQRAKSQEMASRLAYLIPNTFEFEGFKSNEPTPSLAACRAMAARNVRKVQTLRQTPCKSG